MDKNEEELFDNLLDSIPKNGKGTGTIRRNVIRIKRSRSRQIQEQKDNGTFPTQNVHPRHSLEPMETDDHMITEPEKNGKEDKNEQHSETSTKGAYCNKRHLEKRRRFHKLSNQRGSSDDELELDFDIFNVPDDPRGTVSQPERAPLPSHDDSILERNVRRRKRSAAMEALKRKRIDEEAARMETDDQSPPSPKFYASEGVGSNKYYETVKVTEEGTEFPMDFLAPHGLSFREYDYTTQNPMFRNREPPEYNGYNDKRYASEAENIKVPHPSTEDLNRYNRNVNVLMRKKESYIHPTSNDAIKKYERFILRKPISLPKEFPIPFYPTAHSYEYTKNNGLENIFQGTLEDGHSCTVRLTGFRPYLYLQIPTLMQCMNDRELIHIFSDLLCALNATLKEQMVRKRRFAYQGGLEDLIDTTPRIVRHVNSRNFQGKDSKKFLQIHTVSPAIIRPMRLLLQAPYGGKIETEEEGEEGESHESWLPESLKDKGIPKYMTVLEADVDYTTRFSVDTGLDPAGCWFIFNHYPVVQVPRDSQISRDNLEIRTSYRNVRGASEQYCIEHPPNRVDAKFDIEVETSDRFPRYDTNAVCTVVIRNRFGKLGEAKPNDPETLVETPMPKGQTIRKPGCSAAVCFSLGSIFPSKHYSALAFEKERDLLLAILEYWSVCPPDFIAGHYSNVFDFLYLLMRAEYLGIYCFAYFARLFKNKVTNNANENKRAVKKGIFRPVTRIPGVVVWDTYNYAEDFMFAKTKSLNALGEKYLKKQKLDIEYSLIGTLLKTKRGRSIIAKYCNYDVVLLELLDDKVSALRFLHQMSNMCSVPIQALGDRASTFRMSGIWRRYAQRFYNIAYRITGSPNRYNIRTPGAITAGEGLPEVQVDMKSLFSKTHPDLFHDKNLAETFFLTPTPNPYEPREPKKDYPGGCVMENFKGFFKDPVQTLDFMSLYPTIIRTFNLCFISFVPKGQQEMVCHVFGLDMKKDLWHEPHFMLHDSELTTRPYIDPSNKPSYIREHVVIGLIRYIEEQLMNHRTITKGEMGEYYRLAKETDDPIVREKALVMAGNKNLVQLAQKIVCNMIYGILGMGAGCFSLKPTAETITNMARQALEFTRYNIMRNVRKDRGWDFNVAIVYGDSVTGNTPLIIRQDGGCPEIIRIDELFNDKKWESYNDTKESIETPGIEVWQDGGFTSVDRIIRHKTEKRLFRVLTHTGIVDCTEDHSLLRANGDEARPEDMIIGDELLHASDKSLISDLNSIHMNVVTENEAFAMGLFVADGTCGTYGGGGKAIQYSWSIGKKDRDLLEEAATRLPFPTKIVDMLKSSKVYKLIPSGCSIKKITQRYRSLFYNNHREKRIPIEILCAKKEVISEFWRGFYAGDGDKSGQKIQKLNRFDQRGKEVTTGLWLIARRLGWRVSINDRSDKPNIFRLTFSDEKGPSFRKPAKAIKKIRELPKTEEYVYDLQTGSHHFHVGPGDMVVHNTDSVFVMMLDLIKEKICEGRSPNEQEFKDYIFEQFDAICAMQNRLYGGAMLLQNEKNAIRGFFVTPKCYAIRMAEGKNKDYFNKASGLSCVRRGGCKLARDMCTKMVDAFLNDGDPKKAEEIAAQTVKRVMTRNVTQAELLMRSSLSKGVKQYDKKTAPPHVAMAEKIMKRGGGELHAGDRVYYIVVPGPPKAKVRDRVEAPEVVIDHGLDYDMGYYKELVMKEARKILRTIVTLPSFVDNFINSDWTRRTLGKPGGKDLVKKHKNEEKKFADKEVDSMILNGREVDYSSVKEPSFYDLPEEYQKELPNFPWHWAGFDPNEEVPHISEYNPPWIKNDKDRSQLLKELEEREKDNQESEEDEKTLQEEIKGMGVASMDLVDSESLLKDTDILEKEDSVTKKKEDELVPFLKLFKQAPSKKTKLSKKVDNPRQKDQRKQDFVCVMCGATIKTKFGGVCDNCFSKRNLSSTLKKASLPQKNAFSKFLVPQDNCTFCGKNIGVKLCGVCHGCFAKKENRYKRKEYQENIRGEIASLKEKWDTAEKICEDHVVSIIGEKCDEMVKQCYSFECPNWALRRQGRVNYEKKVRDSEPILAIQFDIDGEDYMQIEQQGAGSASDSQRSSSCSSCKSYRKTPDMEEDCNEEDLYTLDAVVADLEDLDIGSRRMIRGEDGGLIEICSIVMDEKDTGSDSE